MWLEAVLSRDDFVGIAADFLPLGIRLGEPDSGHYVLFDQAEKVELVESRGLRISANTQLRWPVLGIDLPVDVEGLTLLVEPRVEDGSGKLSFHFTIERADVAFLPTVIDDRIVRAVNESIAKRQEDLSWNFARALTHDFLLPDLLAPLNAIGLEVLWGKVRTSTEAMVLAVSFRAVAVQSAERRARPDKPAGHAIVRPAPEIFHPSPLSVAAATAAAMTAGYVTAKTVRRFFRHAHT
jgi:hypothetical protein